MLFASDKILQTYHFSSNKSSWLGQSVRPTAVFQYLLCLNWSNMQKFWFFLYRFLKKDYFHVSHQTNFETKKESTQVLLITHFRCVCVLAQIFGMSKNNDKFIYCVSFSRNICLAFTRNTRNLL